MLIPVLAELFDRRAADDMVPETLAPSSENISRPMFDFEGLKRPENASRPKTAARDRVLAVGVLGLEFDCAPVRNLKRPN